jgi:retinol dehydrogenase-14
MPGEAAAVGACTSVYLATSPEVEKMTGKYFDNCTELAAAAQALDQQLARQLWDWSEQAVGDFLETSRSGGG